jgi:hypothetical protein
MGAQYGNLTPHNEVRLLSAGREQSRACEIKREMLALLYVGKKTSFVNCYRMIFGVRK